MSEVLLGFQLRVDCGQMPNWSSDERAKYLLVASVSVPISVDTTVWPISINQSMLSRIFEDYSSEPFSAPNGLSVYRLRVALELLDRREGSVPIAITTLNEDADDLKTSHHIEDVGYTVADLSARGWQRLGYDVADRWLTSGLMNCGYAATEKQALKASYGGLINDHHLFRETSDAIAFSVQCSARVAGHAPFLVYGIWSNLT